MSKNITIQEGGIARQMTANKLKTNLVGGGTCLWVPEDEVQLGTKYVTDNGTYKASDEGLYGYSEVTVTGIGSVTGKDPTTGQEVTVTTDPETGEIMQTVVPVEIRVIEPPTNPYGVYVDGQTIAKDGMVVKAYDALGNEMMIVPNGEIALEPGVAVYDESTDIPISTAESEIGSIKFIASESAHFTFSNTSKAYLFDSGFMFLTYNGEASVWGMGNRINYTSDIPVTPSPQYPDGRYISQNWNNLSNTESAVLNYNIGGMGYLWNAELPSMLPQNNVSLSIKQVAEILRYGNIDAGQPGSIQTITVSWPRPGDGQVLDTTFEIRVGP